MAEGRLSQAEKGAKMGVITNFAVSMLKGFAAIFSGSFALFADAMHSLTDAFGSLAVWLGLKLSKKPDRNEPNAPGKNEALGMMIVAVVLFVIAIELLIQAVRVAYSGETIRPAWYAFAALFVSIVLKEGLYQYRVRRSKMVSSKLLLLYNEERRQDIGVTFIVLLGMSADLFAAKLGLPWLWILDPFAGIVIACLMFYKGLQLVRRAVHAAWHHELMAEEAMPLMKTVQNVDGVILIKELKATEHGHYVIVQVTIGVNPNLSVAEGYQVGHRVKEHLMHRYLHVADVDVHVHPLERDDRYQMSLEEPSSHWIQ
ncbi:MAG: cation transporter [Paenibacillus sp.]|nr:cation transporter [Paenibacillus sp.]